MRRVALRDDGLVCIRTTDQREAQRVNVGVVIMLGTLLGLIVLIFALVRRYDPEARARPAREDSDA